MKKLNFKALFALLLLLASLLLGSCDAPPPGGSDAPISLDSIPAFSGEPFVAVNGNVPFFTEEDYTTKSFESYSELDVLGRTGVAYACIGRDLMPTEERDFTLDSTPSGWKYNGKSNNTQYDCVPGWIYNRCHLIGWQLTAEGDNELNLITGTRYLNVGVGERGMLLFENQVADYIKETGNHVLYRVTPIYEGNNLVCSGLLMEGYSVEDEGDGILFCVYLYNVQPGVEINYATGTNRLSGDTSVDLGPTENETPSNPDEGGSEGGEGDEGTEEQKTYILNTNTKKYHLASCGYAPDAESKNRKEFSGTLEALKSENPDYEPCARCHPDGEE